MTAAAKANAVRPRRWTMHPGELDPVTVVAAAALLTIGLVMVASASINVAARQFGQPWHFSLKQAAFIGLALVSTWAIVQVPLARWQQLARPLLLLALLLLALVLVPGFGRTVNGSTRWLELGAIGFQVSEAAKLAVLIYLADYVVRRREDLQTAWSALLGPLAAVALAAFLLLLEPDFGAAVVLLLCAVTVLFLGGVPLLRFGVLVATAGVALAILAVSSPYRLERISAFLDPWADPFNSGFQLTQSLIAIGSGAWTGVGLGSSVQKLFYLPEAHTDFLFAIFAEETGLLGVVVVIGLYGLLVGRAFQLAGRAHRACMHFAGYLAAGIAVWISLQAFMNIGVNMGLLPTKGLTLPLMSYGGSSTLITCAGIGLLLRIHYETALQQRQARRRERAR